MDTNKRSNKKYKFKIGDIVQCTGISLDSECVVGKKGVIIKLDSKRPLILYDDDVSGHYTRHWYTNACVLKLYCKKQIEKRRNEGYEI